MKKNDSFNRRISEISIKLWRDWLKDGYHGHSAAFSYWHANNSIEIGSTLGLRKGYEDLYWGALVLTNSHLLWGGLRLESLTTVAIPLEWIDSVSIHPGLRPIRIKTPPPSPFKTLTITITERKANRALLPFPGMTQPDLPSASPTQQFTWTFAISTGGGDNLYVGLKRRFPFHVSEGVNWEAKRQNATLTILRIAPQNQQRSHIDGRNTSQAMQQDTIDGVNEPKGADHGLACHSCGTSVIWGANFCYRCGLNLVSSLPTTPVSPSPLSSEGHRQLPSLDVVRKNPDSVPSFSGYQPRPKHGNKVPTRFRTSSVFRTLISLTAAAFALFNGLTLFTIDNCESIAIGSTGGRRVSVVRCLPDDSGLLPVWLTGSSLVALGIGIIGFEIRSRLRQRN